MVKRPSIEDVFKDIYPDAQVEVNKIGPIFISSYNNELSARPDLFNIVHGLKKIGYNFPDPSDVIEIDNLIFTLLSVAKTPNVLSKLTSSPEELDKLSALSARFSQEFKFKLHGEPEIERLVELYDDKKLQEEIFAPDNASFVRKMRPGGIGLYEIKPMLGQSTQQRELLVKLVEYFNCNCSLDITL